MRYIAEALINVPVEQAAVLIAITTVLITGCVVFIAEIIDLFK